MAAPDKLSYTIQEAHDATGINKRTLESMCKAKKLRAVKVGKNWIIPARALLKLLGEDDEALVDVTNATVTNG